MNKRRMIVLLLAAVAAGGAALLVRGMFGGGVEKVQARILAPKQMAMVEVLVATSDIAPGMKLTPGMAHWQQWPKESVRSDFIVGGGDIDNRIRGSVARAPLVQGEPLTAVKVVKSDSTGFMAATLQPGMRAVSIPVTIASVAGGFILPNDRVDVLLTKNGGSNNNDISSGLVITDVRVLAIDQAVESQNNKPVPEARTATLELTPEQARDLAKVLGMGNLSLALRPMLEAENNAMRIVHGFPPGFETGGDK